MEIAILAGGCFWCTEAIFRRLKGVDRVTPGYIGGKTSNPTYEQVSSGNTGHAEAIKIEFDPKVISFEKLLEVFWKLHDPTNTIQPGTIDAGHEYRSAIFYTSEVQKQIAEESKQEAQTAFDKSILTEITKASAFYPAEGYHKDFYEKNKGAGYCRIIIDPKLQKLYKDFREITTE
jgi:peptide-methionine (S)-S-oxide reductase